ncbi:hypothetical protein [Methylobacterium symbioticum]|uniref:Uncharacterized protein n=1 Tax=Methylobacterium symbioticum TaxID=2584084 RepID=A0A509EAX4_9HYPH|nr:hypothetical protein [Methylobacterium symbioticum]VUD71288.1 hypothetical protein MET9862_01866 [Methylobacterium symbioticum]
MNAAVGRRLCMAAMAALIVSAPAGAADLLGDGFGAPRYAVPASPPRYFPRSDDSERIVRRAPPPPAPIGCVPRRVPIPTNAPDDPSYVGSAYGLSRPSYYGLTPPPGIDDPFGRALLPYCP